MTHREAKCCSDGEKQGIPIRLRTFRSAPCPARSARMPAVRLPPVFRRPGRRGGLFVHAERGILDHSAFSPRVDRRAGRGSGQERRSARSGRQFRQLQRAAYSFPDIRQLGSYDRQIAEREMGRRFKYRARGNGGRRAGLTRQGARAGERPNQRKTPAPA